MPDTGWVDLISWSDDSSYGTEDWINADNARYEDNNFAVSSWSSGPKDTWYLKGLNLDSPGIPVGATILGVEVRVKRKKAGVSDMTDKVLRLVVGGTVSGNNKADTSTDWPITNNWSNVYGGPSDLWGLSLTQAQVDANNFGIVLAAGNGSSAGTAYVDCIEMRITYTTKTEIEAVLNATSSLAGALSADVPLAGVLNATSSLTAFLSADVALRANLDAVSSLSAFMRAKVPVQAQLDALSSLSGSLIRTVGLFATLDGVSYLAGSITADVPLSAELNATSGLDGFLRSSVPLASLLEGTSGLVAEIHFNKAALVTSLDATSGLATFLRSHVPLQAVLDAASGFVADLTPKRLLQALLEANSGLDGVLIADRKLVSEIVGQSGFEVELTAARLLSALLSAESGFLVRIRVLGEPEQIAWLGRLYPVHSWKGRIS